MHAQDLDIPEEAIRPFFERFAKHVDTWSEVQQESAAKQNVKSITFEYNPRVIEGYPRDEHGAAEQGDEADER